MITFKYTKVGDLRVGSQFLRPNLDGTTDLLTVKGIRISASLDHTAFLTLDDDKSARKEMPFRLDGGVLASEVR